MKTFVVVLCIVVVANAVTMEMFEGWSVKYGKTYSESEKAQRFQIFQNNQKIIERLNQQSETGVTFGNTKYADLTPEEFKARFLTMKVSDPFCPLAPNASNGPSTWDWRTKNAVLPIKDQGGCGSCWAFSAIGNMESIWFLAGHTLTSFSEQQIVDCDHTCDPNDPNSCDDGCNGGLPTYAFNYVIKNGIESEASYPYTGEDDTCAYKASKVVAKFTSCKMIANDMNVVANAVAAIGPLSIGVYADPWQFYISGIFSSSCSNAESSLDHGVVLVGYGTEGKKDFWIVRNSWGEDWGESGYIRVLRSTKNLCGITDEASTIVV